MKIQKAFKYRLKTTPELEKNFSIYAGQCRFVWNKVLRMNLDRLENKQNILYYDHSAFWLTFWKQSDDYAFLTERAKIPVVKGGDG